MSDSSKLASPCVTDEDIIEDLEPATTKPRKFKIFTVPELGKIRLRTLTGLELMNCQENDVVDIHAALICASMVDRNGDVIYHATEAELYMINHLPAPIFDALRDISNGYQACTQTIEEMGKNLPATQHDSPPSGLPDISDATM